MLSRSALSKCCRRSLFSRSLATSVENIPVETAQPPPPSKKGPKSTVNTAIILNRSPFLTRDSSDFERAYHAYQGRLRRALHNPFPYEFYFKEGSILETRFRVEEMKRERAAFGSSFGKEDVLDKEKFEAQKAAAAQLAEQEGELEDMMPREHPSDVAKDYKSLDRAGTRNLYLVVKAVESGSEVWRFPQGEIEKQELLHQAAQRNLHKECDKFMDTWIVSRNPIGVYRPPAIETTEHTRPQVTFFYKGHIMAGQVRPTGAVKDFEWLTKEEIEQRVDAHYWNGVKSILSDQ